MVQFCENYHTNHRLEMNFPIPIIQNRQLNEVLDNPSLLQLLLLTSVMTSVLIIYENFGMARIPNGYIQTPSASPYKIPVPGFPDTHIHTQRIPVRISIPDILAGTEKLENDPMCGTVTGGQEECFWDCRIKRRRRTNSNSTTPIYKDPLCMKDCYPAADHCIYRLLSTYEQAGGVCKSYETGWPMADPLPPACTSNDGYGVCSSELADLLKETFFTGNEICEWNFKDYRVMDDTVYWLYRTMCNRKNDYGEEKRSLAHAKEGKSSYTKLNPLGGVFNYGTKFRIEVNFENTRHRYPWICSLRAKNSEKTHYCGVTLLRRPPGPIVMITAAHCTLICKDGDTTVDNCCCDNVRNETCPNGTNCGTNPEVKIMTGEDSEVICGEWEIGTYSQADSNEEYNVIFNIVDIVLHPDYNINRGVGVTQFVVADIATIYVEDVSEQVFQSNRLFPACLPTGTSLNVGDFGIHSGWSSPPPQDYADTNPNFEAFEELSIYRDFQKQWHWNMEVTECLDPTVNENNGQPLNFPTNTYYPEGLMCAKEKSRLFCPTSGESGSPLMRKLDGKYIADGILSFIKGCSVFNFRDAPGDADDPPGGILGQLASNPLAYTKLACYLPWIASQYGLEYEESDDPACKTGSGDINDVTEVDGKEQCTTVPLQFTLYRDNDDDDEWFNLLLNNQERECIFPFYIGDQRFESCTAYGVGGLNSPVFICPTFNIITKKDGINQFTSQQYANVANGMCPSDASDDNSDLDPSIINCADNVKRIVFSQCKNNCPGVNFPVVATGAALIFAGALAAAAFPSPLVVGAAGAGLLGLGFGGNMVAQSNCLGPLYCRVGTGQCCLLVQNNGRFECPSSC